MKDLRKIIPALQARTNAPEGGYLICSQGDGAQGTFGLLVGVSDNEQSYKAFVTAHHVVDSSNGICTIGQISPTDRADIITPYNSSYPCCDPVNGEYLIFSDSSLDVAVCKVDIDVRHWGRSTVYDGKRLASAKLPKLNQVVYKVGQATGITSGYVYAVSNHRYVVISSTPTPFCNNGDSGAPVYDAGGNWYGIITSGKNLGIDLGIKYYGVFTSAVEIVNRMRDHNLSLQLI